MTAADEPRRDLPGDRPGDRTGDRRGDHADDHAEAALRAAAGAHTGDHPLAASRVAPLLREIERKDLSTLAHTWRVVLYTRAMGEAAGVGPERLERLSVAAAVHDLGKLDVPDAVLKKPGPLTDAEFDVIRAHPASGYDRLVRMDADDETALALVRWHHERLDGRGYPDGLPGPRIPIEAKFFAVVDSFDAMTSVRPYRSEVGERAAEHALAELAAGAGSRYCDEAVGLFRQLYRGGGLDWVLHYFNDSCPVPGWDDAAPDGPSDTDATHG